MEHQYVNKELAKKRKPGSLKSSPEKDVKGSEMEKSQKE